MLQFCRVCGCALAAHEEKPGDDICDYCWNREREKREKDAKDNAPCG